MFTQKSFVLKPAEATKKWHLIDATDKVVGRLATEVANLLRGKKTNPQFTFNQDSGDFVVIINADKVKLTGNKWEDKKYFWHTGHTGGIKSRTAKEQLAKHPELIILDAVQGMLPKTSQGRAQLTKLRVFTGATHAHEAQKPVEYKF